LNPVLSGQLYEGLVAVPDQFRGDLVFAECFNCRISIARIRYQKTSSEVTAEELSSWKDVAK
jgi:hypothetical protein